MCEHSRRRYAARVVSSRGIPEPRMSQLPTNPILAALPGPSVIGVYQQDSPSMLPRTHVVPRPPACPELLTSAQSYQRLSSAANESNRSACAACAILKSFVGCNDRYTDCGQEPGVASLDRSGLDVSGALPRCSRERPRTSCSLRFGERGLTKANRSSYGSTMMTPFWPIARCGVQ